jgi:hypothetical protein
VGPEINHHDLASEGSGSEFATVEGLQAEVGGAAELLELCIGPSASAAYGETGSDGSCNQQERKNEAENRAHVSVEARRTVLFPTAGRAAGVSAQVARTEDSVFSPVLSVSMNFFIAGVRTRPLR